MLTTHLAMANLLINPSFEDTIPMFGWTRFGAGPAPELAHVDAQEEENCVKMFQDFTGADNWTGLYQDTPVKSGAKYRLAGYLRNGLPDGQDTLQDGNSAWMKVEWFDANDNMIYAKEFNEGENGLTPASESGKWMLNDVQENAPENAVKARIVLLHQYLGTGHNGGSSWFDNISFQQVP
jgi:hypothetical protein